MAKGDGWAVQRYVCPNCKKKGLMYKWNDYGGKRYFCMYRCSKPMHDHIDVVPFNPILLTELPRKKPKTKKP